MSVLLDEFSTAAAVAALLIVVAAAFLHGAVGFGFPMLATPLLAAVSDVRTAIMLTLFPTAALNIVSILGEGRWAEGLGRYWPVAVFAVLGSVAGSYLLVSLDPEPFRLVLAGLILLYLFVQRRPQFHLGFVRRHHWWGMGVFGIAAGLSAGVSNVMVPVLIIYGLELGLGAAALVPLFNLCFLGGKLAQIGVFAQMGALTAEAVRDGALLAVPAVLTLLGGRRLRRRIDAERYRRLLRYVLAALALLLIAQYLL